MGVPEAVDGADPGAAWWLAIAFATFWVGLLAHEAAHYAVASIVSADWASAILSWRRGASAAAGPLLTLAIVAGCALLAGSVGRLRWIAVATAIGAASRLAIIAVPTMMGKENDERLVGFVFGISAKALWTTEAFLTVLLMWIIISRSGVSRRAIVLCCGGTLIGLVSAFTLGRAIGLPI